MKLTQIGISGAWLADSEVRNDERGYFREWLKQSDIKESLGFDFSIKQANFSMSKKGVVRGIHFSLAPQGQAKWVTCVSGSIVDVIVDIRPNSPTFKKAEYIKLRADSGKSLLIGEGLGHGFISLGENSGVSYLLSSEYNPKFEFGINPFDSQLCLDWGRYVNPQDILCSTADNEAPSLQYLIAENLLPLL
jgi:dTDP-4-dehydrorhamnose 3,5-epimerase